jgi:hypothetical protein
LHFQTTPSMEPVSRGNAGATYRTDLTFALARD